MIFLFWDVVVGSFKHFRSEHFLLYIKWTLSYFTIKAVVVARGTKLPFGIFRWTICRDQKLEPWRFYRCTAKIVQRQIYCQCGCHRSHSLLKMALFYFIFLPPFLFLVNYSISKIQSFYFYFIYIYMFSFFYIITYEN